jgi:hypothetical protein
MSVIAYGAWWKWALLTGISIDLLTVLLTHTFTAHHLMAHFIVVVVVVVIIIIAYCVQCGIA